MGRKITSIEARVDFSGKMNLFWEYNLRWWTWLEDILSHPTKSVLKYNSRMEQLGMQNLLNKQNQD